MSQCSSSKSDGRGDILEFTGERYTPEKTGNIYLEHMHRYVMVRDLIEGRDVLDIASGEGFGSADMALVARSVIGVDIDIASVLHAQGKYRAPNLEFRTGSCADIPLGDGSVDVVVSFETIEHHDQHDRMMQEIRRVLRSGGLLIISSPEKHEYTDVPGTRNPFHVKELYRDEFKALLATNFRNVAMYGQRVVFGSALFLEGMESRTQTFDAHRLDLTDGVMRPIYLIAIASDAALPALPASSFFEEDVLNSEVVGVQIRHREAERDAFRMNAENLHAAVAESEKIIADRDQMIATLDDVAVEQARYIRAVHISLTWKLAEPIRTILRALLGPILPRQVAAHRKRLRRPPPYQSVRLPQVAAAIAPPAPTVQDNPSIDPSINLLFPIGHFYSPIADTEDIAARKDQIFRRRDGSAGIDYRERAQLDLIEQLAPHVRKIDYPIDDPGDGRTYFYGNDLQYWMLTSCMLRSAIYGLRG